MIPRAAIFSLRIGDHYLSEEEVGLSTDAVSGNKEGDVSPKERLRVIKAGVDTVVGAAVGVGVSVAVVITARAGITIAIQVAGGLIASVVAVSYKTVAGVVAVSHDPVAGVVAVSHASKASARSETGSATAARHWIARGVFRNE